MTNQAKFWDKIAPKYAKSAISDQAAYEYTLGRTQSYLQSGDRVLELGCGTGSTAVLLAPHVAQFTATDTSSGMIALARGKVVDADLANMTCEVASEVPATGDYTVVMGFNLFHLVRDMEDRFAQIHALLPKGGYFISKTPCLHQRGGVKAMLLRVAIHVVIPLMQMIGKAPDVRGFSIATLEKGITQAGFEIVESGNHPIGPPPARYIVARKV